jgi:hypothetical protein
MREAVCEKILKVGGHGLLLVQYLSLAPVRLRSGITYARALTKGVRSK